MDLHSSEGLREGASRLQSFRPVVSGESVSTGRNRSESAGTTTPHSPESNTTRKTNKRAGRAASGKQMRLLATQRTTFARAPRSARVRRFLKFVETTNANGCQIWKGAVGQNGYGVASSGGTNRPAHRLAWTLFRGAIPAGHEIDHTCFNRLCVNVEHLEPVTREENQRRATQAGRFGGLRTRTVGVVDAPRGNAPVTKRQIEVLRFIAGHVAARGTPPTIREIGTALRITSTNGVNDHIKTPERKGLITREELKSRTLELTRDAMRVLGLQVEHHRCLTCGQALPSPTTLEGSAR